MNIDINDGWHGAPFCSMLAEPASVDFWMAEIEVMNRKEGEGGEEGVGVVHSPVNMMIGKRTEGCRRDFMPIKTLILQEPQVQIMVIDSILQTTKGNL